MQETLALETSEELPDDLRCVQRGVCSRRSAGGFQLSAGPLVNTAVDPIEDDVGAGGACIRSHLDHALVARPARNPSSSRSRRPILRPPRHEGSTGRRAAAGSRSGYDPSARTVGSSDPWNATIGTAIVRSQGRSIKPDTTAIAANLSGERHASFIESIPPSENPAKYTRLRSMQSCGRRVVDEVHDELRVGAVGAQPPETVGLYRLRRDLSRSLPASPEPEGGSRLPDHRPCPSHHGG